MVFRVDWRRGNEAGSRNIYSLWEHLALNLSKSGSFFNALLPKRRLSCWAPVALSSCTLHELPFSRWEVKFRSAACPSSALWALHRHTQRALWVMKTPREASLQTEKQTFILFRSRSFQVWVALWDSLSWWLSSFVDWIHCKNYII